MTANKNFTIEKNSSFAYECIPSVDLSDYTFVYMAKFNAEDADSSAKVNIIPTIQTKNVSDLDLSPQDRARITTETVKTVLITFLPSVTANVDAGVYEHSCRAISADKQTVFVLFNGNLTLTQNRINQPA
jgi:hypothetical protein